jgi:RNA polymerase sigma factor (sigma-70 family)
LNTSHKEDRRLVEGFLAGRKHEYETILRWISQVVKLNSWALTKYFDDITQDVLLKLYGNLKENRFEFAASLKTYVYRIAKFTCIDYLRRYSSKEQKEVELAEIPSNDNPEKEVQKKEERTIFWRIYRLMSSECRQLWRMIFWEDLPYQQIAQRLSVREGTVKSRFARCKEKAIGLREKLTEKREPL